MEGQEFVEFVDFSAYDQPSIKVKGVGCQKWMLKIMTLKRAVDCRLNAKTTMG